MDEVKLSTEGGVATIRLNRPARLNAFSETMFSRLSDVLSEVELDETIRIVVLTGAGRGFCSGGDVVALAQASAGMDFDGRVQRLQRWHRIPQMIRAIPKVFVAAVNGPAAGMGFGLALACDLRIAAASAKFVTSFAKVGFSGDFGGPYFLAQLVGSARARQLYYLSETVSADEALALGLVNWVAPDADFSAELARLSDRLLQSPSVALGYMKRNFNFAETAGLGEYLDLEAVHQVRTAFTEDHIKRVSGR